MPEMSHLLLSDNRLRGPIPESFRSLTQVQTVHLFSNDLWGPIPDLASSLFHFNVSVNKLSGTLPDGFGCYSDLGWLDLSDNRLSGPIPGSFQALQTMSLLAINNNELRGSIPEAVLSLRDLRNFELAHNTLRGPFPAAFGVPIEGITPITTYIMLANNELSGLLPDAMPIMETLDISNNRVSGSLSDDFHLCTHMIVSKNRLMGSIPISISWVQTFLAAENFWEGILPRIQHDGFGDERAPRLQHLVVSQDHDGTQLHGYVPNSLARARQLTCFIAQRNRLQGDTPAFALTLETLALHGNMMKRLRHDRFTSNSSLFLQHNALSCHLPRRLADDVRPRVTLCAVGNQLQGPSQEWLSNFEQHGLFWSTGREGGMLVTKVMSAVIVFGATLSMQLGPKKILTATARLQSVSGCPSLANMCASQLPHLSLRGVLCVAILMPLMDWVYYKCPRTLTLASACRADSANTNLAVVLLWIQASGHCQLSPRWTHCATCRPTARCSAKSLTHWAMWLAIVLPLSSLAVLNLASMCVPGFLYIDGLWLQLVNLGIGACQGLVNSILIPFLAERLTPNKHMFTSTAAILTAVCLPFVCIIFFDHMCLGRWTEWWGACSGHEKQKFMTRFQIRVAEEVGDVIGQKLAQVDAMKPDEICLPHHGEPSGCAMTIALNMQSMVMSKAISTSLLIPLKEISMGKFPTDVAILAAGIARLKMRFGFRFGLCEASTARKHAKKHHVK